MRVRKSISMVAAVVSVAGLSAPAANAFDSAAPSGPGTPPVVAAPHRSSSSTDWLVIGVSGAGAITLAGVGVGATRRLRTGATARGERLVTR